MCFGLEHKSKQSYIRAHCLDPEQYFVKRRSNLDGPASNYIWFGEKQILYTDHWIISDLDVYSTDVSSILRLEKESVAIYVTILTRILKWKWRVHPDCSRELRYGAPPVKTVDSHLQLLQHFQEKFVRRLLWLPSSVPKVLLEYDTGLEPMKWRIAYRKLNILRKIMEKPAENIAKSVI